MKATVNIWISRFMVHETKAHRVVPPYTLDFNWKICSDASWEEGIILNVTPIPLHFISQSSSTVNKSIQYKIENNPVSPQRNHVHHRTIEKQQLLRAGLWTIQISEGFSVPPNSNCQCWLKLNNLLKQFQEFLCFLAITIIRGDQNKRFTRNLKCKPVCKRVASDIKSELQSNFIPTFITFLKRSSRGVSQGGWLDYKLPFKKSIS